MGVGLQSGAQNEIIPIGMIKWNILMQNINNHNIIK